MPILTILDMFLCFAVSYISGQLYFLPFPINWIATKDANWVLVADGALCLHKNCQDMLEVMNEPYLLPPKLNK